MNLRKWTWVLSGIFLTQTSRDLLSFVMTGGESWGGNGGVLMHCDRYEGVSGCGGLPYEDDVRMRRHRAHRPMSYLERKLQGEAPH